MEARPRSAPGTAFWAHCLCAQGLLCKAVTHLHFFFSQNQCVARVRKPSYFVSYSRVGLRVSLEYSWMKYARPRTAPVGRTPGDIWTLFLRGHAAQSRVKKGQYSLLRGSRSWLFLVSEAKWGCRQLPVVYRIKPHRSYDLALHLLLRPNFSALVRIFLCAQITLHICPTARSLPSFTLQGQILIRMVPSGQSLRAVSPSLLQHLPTLFPCLSAIPPWISIPPTMISGKTQGLSIGSCLV